MIASLWPTFSRVILREPLCALGVQVEVNLRLSESCPRTTEAFLIPLPSISARFAHYDFFDHFPTFTACDLLRLSTSCPGGMMPSRRSESLVGLTRRNSRKRALNLAHCALLLSLRKTRQLNEDPVSNPEAE
jgi:hypothetical protein